MDEKNRILLVEDDLRLLDGLIYALEKNDFSVAIARTVKEAVSHYDKDTYDLILLDLTLPDGSGFEVCIHVRKYSTVPIIFLTASDEELNIVRGLDIGGDDYITKPFKLNELLSRIKALLRRSALTLERSKTVLKSNGITINLLQNRVTYHSEKIDVVGNEYNLLCLFMRNPNIVLKRQLIMDKLWDGKGDFADDNTLSVYISRLRSKIEENPDKPTKLLTIRGVGYQWKIEG